MRLPIRLRMTAWYVALLAVIIAAVGAFLVVRMHADLVAALDTRLDQGGDQVALGYHAEGRSEALDVSATVLSGEAAASQVLTPTRRVAVSYGDRVAMAPMLAPGELSRVLSGERVRRTVTLGSGREHFRIVARATTRGIYPRVVVVGESLATVDRSVHRLLMLLLLACPVAVAATAVGGWWLARRSLRPIHRLITDAGQIGIDRLDERLPVPVTGDEVARLAATLNTMIGRIEAGVDEQRRLVADASHELRTPLAAMRAELDVSLRADDLDPQAQDILRSTREEVDRLSYTVDGLLSLARADQGALDLQVHPLDLAVVAGETVERLRALARASDVRLEARLEPAPARGDAAWLGHAVANLVDNAIKFSPAGTTVTVSTADEAEEAIVRVLDAGPGIPTDAREHVFDRFRRLDASRTRATGGSGIGLSIVREIARAHGGRAWTEPGPRRGSLFVLAVPTAGDVPASLNGRSPRPVRSSSATAEGSLMEASSTARVLVVAHKTAATPALMDAIRERAARGPARFHLLVPNPHHPNLRHPSEVTHPNVTEGEQVLALALPLIEEACGGRPTDGTVSPRHNPMDAIEETLNEEDFDEIILSTLPHAVSRWLHLDLPHRVAHLGLPLTTVIAQERAREGAM